MNEKAKDSVRVSGEANRKPNASKESKASSRRECAWVAMTAARVGKDSAAAATRSIRKRGDVA
jgi:hypothetical protein